MMYRASSRRARTEIPRDNSAEAGSLVADAKREQEESFRAALGYAANGWPVLPGSTWNGKRFVVPGTTKTTEGLRPTVPRNYATLNVETITSWWAAYDTLVPSVLIRSGGVFQLIKTPINLGRLVAQSKIFKQNAGPVILRPDISCAFFLVQSDPRLFSGFNIGNDDVVVMESGSYAAAPPTRVHGHRVSWLVAPNATKWLPAPFDSIRQALTVAVQQVEPLTQARPYVRGVRTRQGATE
jgi:hypothetical protein